MTLVLDASVTAAWMLPDEENPLAEFVHDLLIGEPAVVPSIWWLKVRNLLVVAERRRRIDTDNADRLLDALGRYHVRLDAMPVESEIVRLARAHGLSIYEACYVELAKRLQLPLATLDGRLARIAASENVSLVSAA